MLSNANKYTNNGHILLTAEESKMNFNVTFKVKDTGIGISEKNLKVLLGSLQQKSRHLGKVARLPGLGLEIAKSICKGMKSKLVISSKEGEGSAFSFEIPTCKIVTFEDISGLHIKRVGEGQIV